MDFFTLKVVLTAANKWKEANIENNLEVCNHHKNSQAIRISRLTLYSYTGSYKIKASVLKDLYFEIQED